MFLSVREEERKTKNLRLCAFLFHFYLYFLFSICFWLFLFLFLLPSSSSFALLSFYSKMIAAGYFDTCAVWCCCGRCCCYCCYDVKKNSRYFFGARFDIHFAYQAIIYCGSLHSVCVFFVSSLFHFIEFFFVLEKQIHLHRMCVCVELVNCCVQSAMYIFAMLLLPFHSNGAYRAYV